MIRWRLAVPGLALMGLTGCVIYVPAGHAYRVPGDRLDRVSRPLELGRATVPGGPTEVYQLVRRGPRHDPRLELRAEVFQETAYLGVVFREIDRSYADRKGLVPYRGLYVRRVVKRSPAARAGVRAGDVLLALGDVELRYRTQVDALLAEQHAPGERVELLVLRGDREGREETVLTATLGGHKRRRMGRESVRLRPPYAGGPAYAGLVLGTVPADWTRRVYGEEGSTVLVGGVLVGSPAHAAGLRTGDRILRANGEAVTDAGHLKSLIQAQGDGRQPLELLVEKRDGSREEIAIFLRPLRTRAAWHHEWWDGAGELDLDLDGDLDGSDRGRPATPGRATAAVD